MLDGGFARFLDNYPVLSQLISRVTDLWIEASVEFTERLARDRDEIERVFGGGRELGRVVRAEPGLSDPHRGGRTVIGLTFESGVRLAYKPKDLGTEHAYNRLLAWLNERDPPLGFRALTIIARRGYGWTEWVEQSSCRNREEVQRYYRRAGMLVCTVYALAGTDCHRENVIAAGEHPVLVDTESLMHHRALNVAAPSSVRGLAHDELVSGVLGTGLLPNWQVVERPEGAPVSDISALHTADPTELVERSVRWRAINSDAMALERSEVRMPIPKSQPLLGDRSVRLEDYAGEVIEGFELFYRYLIDQRAALLEPSSPLHGLVQQPVRFLYRNTRVYGNLQWRLCDPAFLRDEAERTKELGKLSHTLLSGDGERSRWRALVEAEQESMQQMDIPLFWARADGVDLNLAPGRWLRGCLREPSAQLVMGRLRGLSPDDLERQLSFVAGSLHSNAAHRLAPKPRRAARRAGARTRLTFAADQVALEIAAEMKERALRDPGNGGATWIAPQYLPQLERYQLQPIGYDLHSGTCGIALFLAAVARVTDRDEYAELALAALQPLRNALAREAEDLVTGLGFGAATGLGSVVYGLTRIAGLLEEPPLLNEAAAVATLVTPERIAAQPLDVFAGSAGEILGLLTLHAAAPNPKLLERAAECGRRLLNDRVPGAGGHLAWVTFKDRLLTGFSHGAAGMAYALLRLYAVTRVEGYRSAAIDAIAHENKLFDADAGNWPDLREDEQPAYKVNWCHGAPGIGLARIGGLGLLDTTAVRRDVEAAVDTTLRQNCDGADHLCCGNLGRADYLLVAGERLGRTDLAAAARERVEEVAGRAAATGGFSLHAFLPRHVYMPGFFMGMGGVGYQLLRTAHPKLLPSVLLWE